MHPRVKAAVGSVLFLAVAPGVIAGLVPYWVTGWTAAADVPAWRTALGVLLIAAGAGVLLHAFVRFVVEGIGTPAPVAPTQRLVVGGLYRYVRNPMYIAVATTIIGQAVLLARPGLLVYALGFMAVVWTFVRMYEEPVLTARYGAEYEAYCRRVPGWRPRLRKLRG